MKKVILSLLIGFSVISCDNYLDQVSEQTNNPFTEDVPPNKNMAAALIAIYNTKVVTMNSFGQKMVYAQALNSGYTITDAAYSYQFTTDTYTSIWEGLYLNVDNFQDIIDKEQQFPNHTNHYAIAKIMKVYGMQYIISMFGDAPYSDAFRSNEGVLYPKYDDDKQIYKNLLILLDEARQDIANSTSSTVAVGSEDVVFAGQMSMWEKFANTLELKMLLKLSNTTDSELITLRNTRFANLINDFITTDVQINPGYNSSTTSQFNPIYSTWGRTIAGSRTSSRRSFAAGDYIAKVLMGTVNDANITTGVTDPRRSRMYSSTNVTGGVQGTYPSSVRSGLGPFIVGDVKNDGTFMNLNTVSHTESFNNGASRPGYLMLAAESYFLIAEANQRNYLSGNAQANFEAGVTKSFEFFQTGWGGYTSPTALSPTAATYLTNVSAKNGLGWAGSTDKLNAIFTQKWLALALMDGIEPYLDQVRTGLPVIPLPQGVTELNRPKRLMYPTSEYSSNGANVPSVTRDELFTVNSKTPFYLQ